MYFANTHMHSTFSDGVYTPEKLVELGKEIGHKATLIATGGMAQFVTPLCKREIILEKDLLLKGLNIIYKKNRNLRWFSGISFVDFHWKKCYYYKVRFVSFYLKLWTEKVMEIVNNVEELFDISIVTE